MALTVMPSEELENFKDTLAWLQEEDHSKSSFALNSLKLMFAVAPGARPFPLKKPLTMLATPTTIDVMKG